ncbi:hypothetical protein KA013_00915 [Patescibacteria group bacterium]|nr:hypothetical protein [Patescibacteria group bacterium]
MEARYDASLTSDQEQLITVMYFDWLKTRPEYLIDNTALYGGMMEYLPDFYDAREIDRFLWEHKNTLNAL